MQTGENTEVEAFRPTPYRTFLPDGCKGETERPPLHPRFKDVYPQIIASCFAHLLVIHAGINMAFSAILLPQLMDSNSGFNLSLEEESWIASLMAIATPVGSLVCGPFMDLFGRKVFSLLVCVPIGLAWFLMAFTPNSVWIIYLSRVLAGFGGGLTTVSMVYISEISSATWRPMLLCLNSVFVSLGILCTNALGVCLSWRAVAMCAGVLSLVTAAAIAGYNPESPYWLLSFHPESDKQYEKAKQSLRFFYRNQQMFASEWQRLVSLNQERQTEVRVRDLKQLGILAKVKYMAKEFTKRSAVLPLALLTVMFLLQQLSGTYPIIFYAVQVFQSVSGDSESSWLNAYSATVLLGLFRFIMSVLTAGLSRSVGRRTLMVVSTSGMTVSAFAAALYFQKTHFYNDNFNNLTLFSNTSSILNVTMGITGTNSSSLVSIEDSTDISKFIGLVSILLFVVMGSLGMLIIPWTLIGEILPMTIRGTGGGFLVSFAYILMFATVKIFPLMMDTIQLYGLFYFFSFTSFIAVIVIYLFLPETLGKRFEDIEKYFSASHIKT